MNITEENFENCCRTCMDVESTDMFNIFVKDDDSPSTADVLNLCLSIKVIKCVFLIIFCIDITKLLNHKLFKVFILIINTIMFYLGSR